MTLENWSPRPVPDGRDLAGQRVVLTASDWKRDAEDLFTAFGSAGDPDLYRWTTFGPFASAAELAAGLGKKISGETCRGYVIRTHQDGRALGMASFLNIRPAHGSAEIGAVVFGQALQRQPAASEAVFLMLSHLFDDLDYRRAEWKCNAKNLPSRRAGERFGFQYEGTFRNDLVIVKGGKAESRDTDWLSMTGDDWPRCRSALLLWLSPHNFAADGTQHRRLEDIRNAEQLHKQP